MASDDDGGGATAMSRSNGRCPIGDDDDRSGERTMTRRCTTTMGDDERTMAMNDDGRGGRVTMTNGTTTTMNDVGR